jgi:hypothetical protein
MQFQVFDRDPILRDVYSREYAQRLQQAVWKTISNATGDGTYDGPILAGRPSQAVLDILDNIRKNVGNRIIQYADQLPPVDVTMTFVNDLGQVSVARLIGVVFLSTGMAWSTADADNEMSATYLCRKYYPLTPVYNNQIDTWTITSPY